MKTLHEEEKMPKSRTVAHLGLLHQCDGYCCFLAVFSSPYGCQMFLHGVSAPQRWVLKRNQGSEGTVPGMEVAKEGCGLKVMIGLRERQQRKDFAPFLCLKAAIAQQAKMEE